MQILTFQTAHSLKEIIKDTTGAVTFIECRSQPELIGLIQITATNNFPNHVATMQKNNPFPLFLRGFVITPDTDKTLQQIHANLGQYLFRSPWFRPDAKLLEFIEANTQHPPKETVPASALAPTQEKDLIDIEEVAKRLNMSVPTVRRLEQSGKIPSVRTGRLVRFFMPQVLDALIGAQNKK